MSGAIKTIESDWNSASEEDGKSGMKGEAGAEEENAGGRG